MADWSIYVYNENTLNWDADGTIPRPNADMPVESQVNQREEDLATGDIAFFSPEIKYRRLPVTMYWAFQDQTFKDQLETYRDNYDYLKIVTHISGTNYTFIGRFTQVSPVWLAGQEPDLWDITATFVIME